MKTEDLIKIIRKLIREEVQKTVSEEMNKSMARILSEIIHSKNSDIIQETIREEPPKKVYSSNKKLNEALNSTVSEFQKSTQETPPASSEPRVSLSEMFNKIGSRESAVSEPVEEVKLDTSSKIGMLKSIVSKEPVGQQVSVLDTPNPVLGKVFKKDFRALMRKMDEKKNKTGGGFFAGALPMTPHLGGYEQH